VTYLPRGTVTLLFTDIENSTQLQGDAEAQHLEIPLQAGAVIDAPAAGERKRRSTFGINGSSSRHNDPAPATAPLPSLPPS
jgi:hypothetical protein